MRYSHVCTLAFALASITILNATTVLASHLQLEKEPLLGPLALGPTSGYDDPRDPSSIKSGSLRSRDLDQAHTKALMSLREPTSTASKRRPDIYHSHLVWSTSRSKAGYSLSVSERSLLSDLTMIGFRLVWDYMDIAYTSYIAFYQTTELWANITANARGKWKAEKEVMTLDISYGSLKLSIAGLIDAISWELLADFAAEMLVLSRNIVVVAFSVIIFATWAAMVITLAIAVPLLGTIKPQQLITGP